jgi:hypothetical protein
MLVVNTIICVLLIILLLYAYIRFIFRWSKSRLANICIAKFTIADEQKGDDSYSTKYDNKTYFNYSNITIDRDIQPPKISIDIEVRDKESQETLHTIPVQYDVYTSDKDCSIIDDSCVVV